MMTISTANQPASWTTYFDDDNLRLMNSLSSLFKAYVDGFAEKSDQESDLARLNESNFVKHSVSDSWPSTADLSSSINAKNTALSHLARLVTAHKSAVQVVFSRMQVVLAQKNPQIGTLSQETKDTIVHLSYGEMIVIRWSTTFDKNNGLRGLTNKSYNFDQLKALGFWEDFTTYFGMSRKMIEKHLDSVDLGLMAALAIISTGRVSYIKRDFEILCSTANYLGRLLHAKCLRQGLPTKFYALMAILAEMRRVVKQFDLDQCMGFEPKIVKM